MNEILELLPFLIPLAIAELGVCGYTLYHIFTHKSYKRGSRALWVALTIILMNSFIGPILYFLLGREGA
jgi:uncharacterized membrane protein